LRVIKRVRNSVALTLVPVQAEFIPVIGLERPGFSALGSLPSDGSLPRFSPPGGCKRACIEV
jgi:hypothetical protein